MFPESSERISSLERAPNALIVSSRTDHLKALTRALGDRYCVFAAFSLRDAERALARHRFEVVFCDDLVSDGSYRELLTQRNRTNLVLLLGVGEWSEYSEAMRLGAFDVLRCPMQVPEIQRVVEALTIKAGESKSSLSAAATIFAGIATNAVPRSAPLTCEQFEALFKGATRAKAAH